MKGTEAGDRWRQSARKARETLGPRDPLANGPCNGQALATWTRGHHQVEAVGGAALAI